MSEQPNYRQQVREARARLELKRLEHEAKLLEWWGGSAGYGGWPNPFDAPGGPIGPDGRIWMPVAGGRPDDRRDGANRPIVWTDVDLDRMRGLARWLCDNNPIAQGAAECVADYTVSTGYAYQAQPGKRYRKDAVAQQLATLVEEVIDETQSLNTLGEGTDEELVWADREWAAVFCSVRDGDKLIRGFGQTDGSMIFRPIWPEQLRQPPGTGPEWSFGKRNAEGDIEKTLSYAVTYDGPDDWEEVPACEVAHFRRNTDSCVKRGISDFHSTGPALEETWKLLTAMRVSGTAQANIAWIEQHPGATQEGLNALVAKTRNLNPPTLPDPLSGREISSQRMTAGQRLLVGGNRQYVSPPLAANTTQHLGIVSACLQSIAARWKMPEYMISSDASNANYASTLVSGSPFVKRVECRQAQYGRYFLRVLWMAVRHAANCGRFILNGHRYTWQEISCLVDITFTPPQVAIADKLQEAQVDQIDLQSGVLSIQTRRAHRGLDDEQERNNLVEEPPTRVAGKVTDLNAEGDPQAPAKGGSQTGSGPFFPRIAGA